MRAMLDEMEPPCEAPRPAVAGHRVRLAARASPPPRLASAHRAANRAAGPRTRGLRGPGDRRARRLTRGLLSCFVPSPGWIAATRHDRPRGESRDPRRCWVEHAELRDAVCPTGHPWCSFHPVLAGSRPTGAALHAGTSILL